MSQNLKYIQNPSFFKQLFRKTVVPVIAISAVGLLYILMMSFVDHGAFPFPFPYFIMFFAIVKTFVISSTVLRQLSKLIKICHSVEKLLWAFGLLITISIFSFATDYTCLFQSDSSTFLGLALDSKSYIYNLYHFIYFSVITFSTLGFGDIVPVSEIARFIVLLEVFLSFLIVVFVLANINKIRLKDDEAPKITTLN